MRSRANIQVVTFDVGGTLIQPWPSVGHVYAEIAARHGFPDVPPPKLNVNFAAAWRTKSGFQHTLPEWSALVDQSFAGLCDVLPSRTFFPAIYERFGTADVWRTYEDVLPALEALASRDMRLAIVSNWDERLRPLLQQLRLDRYFETLIVSCEVGFAKPSPVIFEQASKKTGVAPDRILHVGDSFNDDVAGARAAGCRALLIDRANAAAGTDRISSLRELETILFPRSAVAS
jgi:putative hydrolase of the HAD superfamily